MARLAIYCWVFSCVFAIGWADDTGETVPARPKVGIRQRVDPQVLKQALNLPEYPAPPETNTALLEDLIKLADKLRRSGDTEAADLLEKFHAEHKELVQKVRAHAAAQHGRLDVIVKVIEVNFDKLPQDSNLRERFADSAMLLVTGKEGAEMIEELDRLVTAKEARALLNPALLVKSEGKRLFRPANEFPIPIGRGTTKLPFEEKIANSDAASTYRATVEASPEMINGDEVRLSTGFEIHVNHVDISSTSTMKIQSVFDLKRGDAAVLTSALKKIEGSQFRWFIIYQCLPIH